MKCPYCDHTFMAGEYWDAVHKHLIPCSKKYVNQMLDSALKQFERDASTVLNRRVGPPDRRKKDTRLYYAPPKPEHLAVYLSGYYVKYFQDTGSSEVCGDRRKAERRQS